MFDSSMSSRYFRCFTRAGSPFFSSLIPAGRPVIFLLDLSRSRRYLSALFEEVVLLFSCLIRAGGPVICVGLREQVVPRFSSSNPAGRPVIFVRSLFSSVSLTRSSHYFRVSFEHVVLLFSCFIRTGRPVIFVLYLSRSSLYFSSFRCLACIPPLFLAI